MHKGGNMVAELAGLVDRQVLLTALWHGEQPAGVTPPRSALGELAEQHHRANFDLWHAEDQARSPDATDAVIAGVKRHIDQLNQRRNDLVERMDEQLVRAACAQTPEAPLHSETPGAMLDRLSILALKLFHTREEIARPEADAAHHRRNRERLAVLEHQHSDLRGCLLDLWAEVEAGRRRFQVYRQLKMYNDPTLNPVLYRSAPLRTRHEPQTPAADPGS